MSAQYPTPPVIGTRVRVLCNGGHSYEDIVTGFDPVDGAVFLAGGEIVANHGHGMISRFEVIQ